MENNDANKLLSDEDNLIKKLHKIVRSTIKEEKLITDNLSHPPVEMLTRGQKISDKVARFGGSWNFIIIFNVSSM